VKEIDVMRFVEGFVDSDFAGDLIRDTLYLVMFFHYTVLQ
jgi:hypothetical protein